MKVRRVYITSELIAAFFTTGARFNADTCVSEGLPEGSVLVAAGWDASRFSYALDFTHETFPDVPNGAIPETLEVRFAAGKFATGVL